MKLRGSMEMKSELQEEDKQGLCSGGKGAMEKEAEVAMEAAEQRG